MKTFFSKFASFSSAGRKVIFQIYINVTSTQDIGKEEIFIGNQPYYHSP